MQRNTLPFVRTTMQCLAAAQIKVCLFGGWAEEVWQLTPPRHHNDIDLLHVGDSFEPLDVFLAQRPQMVIITAKRFSHKRAWMDGAVMIECIALQRVGSELVTSFFDGRYRFIWPADTLSQTCSLDGTPVQVASPAALAAYRSQHAHIEQARAAYVRAKGS